MNTTPPDNSAESPDTSPEALEHSTTTQTPAPEAPARAGGRKPLAFAIAAGIAFLLLLGLWWVVYDDVQSLRSETARRLQAADTAGAASQTALNNVQQSLQDMQSKLSALESGQAEAQSQQLALERLYQELNKNRDDWALAEIEQVLSTAGQQLQLAGNVQGALIALQNAERLLAQSDKPQFVAIRSAIANDIERLKALPLVDMASAALRLDSAISQVDSLPLLSAEQPAQGLAEPKAPIRRDGPAAETAASGDDWLTRLNDNWQSFVAEIGTELRDLVQVRRVDSPDALMMSPTEAYYVRENLKLRLLNARLALLSRNEPAFRNDINAAREIITRYFDTRAKQTQTVLALLKQVQSNNLSIEMPTLSESLTAVRNYKTQP